MIKHSKCELCPAYYKTDENDIKNCVLQTCTELYLVSPVAECEKCPDY